MLGEKAQALSTTPVVFESRLGRRLISGQVLVVFVIVVRPLLPGALAKPPARETLLQEKPFTAGFKPPLLQAALRSGVLGSAWRAKKGLWRNFYCWHRGGRAEAAGCHRLRRCQEGRRGWGPPCAPQSGSQVLVLVPVGR